MDPAAASALVGATVGNYRLLRLLGEGAMGTVYLAEQPEIGRRVAVKMLRPALAADNHFAGRFVAEARAASAVRHAHIVDILDFGRRPDGAPYMVMELLEGETLAARLARVGRLPLAIAVEHARRVASALACAHAAGIVHRDLKPSNLFLCGDLQAPGREMIKVLDFGVAKLRDDPSAVRTRTGAVVGTPAYLSPEQCRGTRAIDQRSDVYALGAVLYEMLCGAPPFVSDGFGDLMDMHMNVAPAPPRRLRAEIPPAVEAVVLRALAKRPEDRFAGMAAMEAALAAAAASVAAAAPAVDTLESSSAALPVAVSPNATVPPVAPSGASGASRAEAPPRRRLVRYSVIGAALAAALAGVLAISAPRRPLATGPEAPPIAERAPASPPAAPPVAVAVAAPIAAAPPAAAAPPSTAAAPPGTGAAPPVAAPAPAAQSPALLTIDIRSLPAGAAVVDAATGRVRGVTPLALKAARGGAPLSLQLKKPGYRAQDLSVPLERDAVIPLQLVRKPAARPSATAGLENL
jgi:serine/threonine-protein kinase